MRDQTLKLRTMVLIGFGIALTLGFSLLTRSNNTMLNKCLTHIPWSYVPSITPIVTGLSMCAVACGYRTNNKLYEF
jgi:hypothetical protein